MIDIIYKNECLVTREMEDAMLTNDQSIIDLNKDPNGINIDLDKIYKITTKFRLVGPVKANGLKSIFIRFRINDKIIEGEAGFKEWKDDGSISKMKKYRVARETYTMWFKLYRLTNNIDTDYGAVLLISGIEC